MLLFDFIAKVLEKDFWKWFPMSLNVLDFLSCWGVWTVVVISQVFLSIHSSGMIIILSVSAQTAAKQKNARWLRRKSTTAVSPTVKKKQFGSPSFLRRSGYLSDGHHSAFSSDNEDLSVASELIPRRTCNNKVFEMSVVFAIFYVLEIHSIPQPHILMCMDPVFASGFLNHRSIHFLSGLFP